MVTLKEGYRRLYIVVKITVYYSWKDDIAHCVMKQGKDSKDYLPSKTSFENREYSVLATSYHKSASLMHTIPYYECNQLRKPDKVFALGLNVYNKTENM